MDREAKRKEKAKRKEEAKRKKKAKKQLDELKDKLNNNRPVKGGGVDPDYDRTPSKDGRKMLRFYKGNINAGIKIMFRKHQVLKSITLTNSPGPEGEGTSEGRELHKLMKKYIQNPKEEPGESLKQKAGRLFAKEMITKLTEKYHGLQIFASEFFLYGYMQKEKDPSKIYYWKGDADVIGWYDNHYVIIDWKTTDNLVDRLGYWNKGTTFGNHLHQCIAYARLLQLHLNLPYLPYVLIVAVKGVDVHPGLFTDFPDKCKDRLKEFEWYVEKPEPFLKVALDEKLFAAGLERLEQSEDRTITVPPDMKLKDLFHDDATVKNLMKALGSLSLKIVLDEEEDSGSSEDESDKEEEKKGGKREEKKEDVSRKGAAEIVAQKEEDSGSSEDESDKEEEKKGGKKEEKKEGISHKGSTENVAQISRKDESPDAKEEDSGFNKGESDKEEEKKGGKREEKKEDVSRKGAAEIVAQTWHQKMDSAVNSFQGITEPTHINHRAAQMHTPDSSQTCHVPTLPHYISPERKDEVTFWKFPLSVSQSTIDGRMGSNACTFISLKVGSFYFNNPSCPQLSPNAPLSQEWICLLIQAILQGNAAYDQVTHGITRNYGVIKAAQSLNLRNSGVSVSAEFPADLAPQPKQTAELAFYLEQAANHQKTAALYIINGNTITFLPHPDGYILVDSHCHDNYGAFIAFASHAHVRNLLQSYRELSGSPFTLGSVTKVSFPNP